MADRANVQVVAGGGDDIEPPAAAVRQQSAAEAPEAQPPVVDEAAEEPRGPDLGGPALVQPNTEQIVQASGGSMAEKMKARYNAISATEEFPVPGWELPSGEPGLIVVARAFGDRQSFNKGVSNEVFIAKSTHKLLFVNDDGEREEIEGGWGPKLAEMIGVKVTKAADLVAIVISKPDPATPRSASRTWPASARSRLRWSTGPVAAWQTPRTTLGE
jgi:hypothetical protein